MYYAWSLLQVNGDRNLRPQIVKVGGSLFDWEAFRSRLTEWVCVQESPLCLVPGGGDAADAIRKLHLTHKLSEIDSHWLAIRTMAIHAHFLNRLLEWPVVDRWDTQTNAILDAFEFCQQDIRSANPLPHAWNVTSDSIAAQVALTYGVELTLLKSTDLPKGLTWEEAAEKGLVDGYFPKLAERGLTVNWVNLRS